MPNPYTVLGVSTEATDEQIRRKYLDLTREFPPEHHPARFAAVRVAYEKIKDVNVRTRHRLFENGIDDSIDAIIEDLACQTPRRRYGLNQLLTHTDPAPR